jgi:hypothetical protein
LYEGRYENNAAIISPENVTAIIMKLTRMCHISFAITILFFHKVSVIFNTLLPTSSQTLYMNVVKFPASTLEHITKTLFQLVVMGKSTEDILQSAKQVFSRWVPDLGYGQDGEEQSMPILRLPHVCASWYEAGHCREGEGRLPCFGYDELYGYVVAVCLKRPCTARDV